VRRLRAAAESYLLQHLSNVPESVGAPGRAFRLLAAAASQPVATPVDLLALACGPEAQLLSFNPFLSAGVCSQLRQGVLTWLQLCVLEDRVERLLKLATAGQEHTRRLVKVCTLCAAVA
jgi:hypothetical protein